VRNARSHGLAEIAVISANANMSDTSLRHVVHYADGGDFGIQLVLVLASGGKLFVDGLKLGHQIVAGIILQLNFLRRSHFVWWGEKSCQHALRQTREFIPSTCAIRNRKAKTPEIVLFRSTFEL